MYNQYQQYSQYQQQQSSSSSLPGVGVGERTEWNGSWASHTNNQQPIQSQIIPPNPVQAYTNYYHGWKKQADGSRTRTVTISWYVGAPQYAGGPQVAEGIAEGGADVRPPPPRRALVADCD